MATYYVDPVNGDDNNTGLNATTEQWATTLYALNTLSAGDEVRLMNTGTETLASTLTETTTGTDELPILMVGADSSGDPLTTGHYTISSNGLGADGYTPTLDYYLWNFVRFTDADATFRNIAETTNTANYHVFNNCRMDNAGSHGITMEGSDWEYRNCEIDNNGGMGIDIDALNRASFSMINCDVHDNDSHGMELAGAGINIYGCRIYSNGGSGIYINRYSSRDHINSNIFYNNTSSGIDFIGSEATTFLVWVFNNIFASNGAYGLKVASTFNIESWFIDNNAYYNNTSNAVDWLGTGYAEGNINGNGFGDSNVGGDPLFTSVTAWAEDFTLGSGSPCIDVGYGYNG